MVANMEEHRQVSPEIGKLDPDLSLQKGPSLAEGAALSPANSGINGGTGVVLKVYKRRFLGYTILGLLNLVISWHFNAYAYAGEYVAEHFNTSASTVNWFATAFLFAATLSDYPASLALRRDTKTSMLCAAIFAVVGSWLKYGGSQIPNVGLTMFGQLLIGFSQSFVINAPVFFSEEWFRERSRTTATAVSSIPGVFGGVLASLVSPAWILGPGDVASVTLYMGIITTGIALFTPFIPRAPPTPPELDVQEHKQKMYWVTELKELFTRLEFYLVAIPFILGAALFNLMATILYPVLLPYGFTPTNIGYGGTIIIVVGEGLSLILSPLCDRYKCHLYIIKICAVLGAVSYIMMVFVPRSGSNSFLFGTCSLLSIAVIAPNPINMEFITEILYPLRVEYAISIMWAGGNLIGAILIIASSYMYDSKGTNMPAVYMALGVSCAMVPMVLALGMFGRKSYVAMNRANDEKRLREEYTVTTASA